MCQTLSVPAMLRVLRLFQADEYAPQAIPPHLLEGLQAEADAGAGRDAELDGDMRAQGPYFPPTDEVIMAGVSGPQHCCTAP